MYSPHNREKLPQGIQVELSEKEKIISRNLLAFLKSTPNFMYLEKKEPKYSLNISHTVDAKKYFYFNAKKQLFQNNLQE